MDRTPPVVSLLCLLCLAAGVRAAASETPRSLPLPADEPALVQFVVPEPDGGFSLYLEDGGLLGFDPHADLIRQSYLPELEVRETGFHRARPPSADGRLPGQHVVYRSNRANFAPGDPVAQIDLRPYCRVRRLTADLDVRLIDGQLPTRVIMHADGVDAQGGVWLLFDNGSVVRHARDCRAESIATTSTPVERMVADNHSRAVYLLAASGQLLRVEPSGIAWSIELPDYADSQGLTPGLDVAADGDILVGYIEDTDFSSVVMRIDPGGSPRWRTVLDRNLRVHYMESLGNSVLLVETNAVLALDADGHMAWSAAEARTAMGSLPRPAASGFSWLRYENLPAGGDDTRTQSVVAYAEASGPVREWHLPSPLRGVAGLAGGGLLAWEPLTSHFFSPGLALFRGDPAPGTPLEAIDLPTRRASHHFGSALVDERGLLAVTWNSHGWRVTELDHAHALRWQVHEELTPDAVTPRFRLAANDTSTCVIVQVASPDSASDNARLQCFDRTDGAALFPSISLVAHEPQLRMLADGRAELLFGESLAPPELRRLLVATDGSLDEPRTPFASAPTLSSRISAATPFGAGHWALVWADSLDRQTLRIVPFGGSGQQISRPIPDVWGTPILSDRDSALATHADRVAVLSRVRSLDTPGAAISVYGLDGETFWQRSFPLVSTASPSALLAIEPGWLLLRADGPRLILTALERDSGNLIWERLQVVPEFGGDEFSGPQAHPVLQLLSQPSGTRFGIVAELPAATRIAWHDASDGRPLATLTTPVRIDPTSAFALGANDELVIAGAAPAGSEPGPTLARTDLHSRSELGSVPAERLRGAWFDPALSGQGLLVEALPAQDLLFAAWFTFSSAGGHQPTELRWYTMQGALSDAATTGLSVLRNRGGVFASAPTTIAEPLGTARLHLAAGGGLQVHFEMNASEDAPQNGGLDLVPLLPEHEVPGPLVWFDPVTTGQGLVLNAPLGAGPILFAGWFTYDPEGHADDPHAHHWFTLQGADGPVSTETRQVQIVRTIGGRLGVEGTGNSHAVGHAALTPLACDRLRLEYMFDDTDLAGDFAGRSGSMLLQPISGCAP